MGKKKTDYGKWRFVALSTVYLLIGLHIFHWKLTGRTLAPLEFNEVLYTIHLGIITAGFIFMGITLLATVVAGRFFCSWMCHMVALQDASAWLLEKLKIKPKFFRSRVLLWIPIITVVYLFILPQIERIYKGQEFLQLRILNEQDGWASFVTNNFWRNLPGIGITLLTFFVCGFFIVYFLGSRSFCQYVCPYGALFSVTDRIAPGKILLAGNCNNCGICTTVCQSHVIVHKEIQHFGRVVDSNCLKDLDCIQACPENALKFGFGKPSLSDSLSRIEGNRKKYDFTLSEDLILGFGFLVFAIVFRGLYDSIPFLLALTLAVLFAWFLIIFKRLIKSDHVKFNTFVLKHSNRLTRNGKKFAVFYSLLLLFTFHSAYIHYHTFMGDRAYNEIADVTNRMDNNRTNRNVEVKLDEAFTHLDISDKFGLYSPASLLRQLSAISLYRKDMNSSKKYLSGLLQKLPGDIEARMRFAKLLYLENEENAAIEELMKITTASVVSKHDKKIRSDAWCMLGHIEEKNGFYSPAFKNYQASLSDNDHNYDAILATGIILTKAGRLNEAEKYLVDAAQYFPNTPVLEHNLSVLYMKQRAYTKAKKHLSRLIMLQPENFDAQYNYAMMNYALGDREVAVKVLKTVLESRPDFKNVTEALAMIESREKSGN